MINQLSAIQTFRFYPLISITIGDNVTIANGHAMGIHGDAFPAYYNDPDGNNSQGGYFCVYGWKLEEAVGAQ